MGRRILLLIAASPPLLALWCYANILADPVVRRAAIALPGWPKGAPPIRVALIGDVHVQGPDMDPARVRRLVRQVNAERPDLVLLAGDFVGDRRLPTRYYADEDIAAALGELRARLGVVAVLGNHDHWRDGPSMRRALEAAGIRVLANEAIRAGPISLAGVDDEHSDHADPRRAAESAARLPGPVVLLTHSPDVIPRLPPRFNLVLAAHTHCGQIVLPFHGPVAYATRYGERFNCGMVRDRGRIVVVTSGWGASVVPFRLGAPPDWWLVTLGPR